VGAKEEAGLPDQKGYGVIVGVPGEPAPEIGASAEEQTVRTGCMQAFSCPQEILRLVDLDHGL
jgi:hypothetical protein